MKYIVLILISFLSFSCSFTDSDVLDIKEKFSENKPEFEKLVSIILNDENLTYQSGYFIDAKSIKKNILENLEDLEIKLDNIDKTDCEKFDVTFELLWDNSVHIFMVKEGCPSEKSSKNYIQKGEMIDTYGLGDGWVLWIDYDFI
ncbi:MAG: hypothetical protein O9282_02755 [Flavobacterium sp.]|uniref:hypothetical protein n=1 Tax=Flavobacterium sp. TaxID=239 RepID=UPI0022C3DA89|nr:hypothetical protein [Flavobacterium sp.]MCZ8330213.1 hypothetical protein [Flavobacterium sp.]